MESNGSRPWPPADRSIAMTNSVVEQRQRLRLPKYLEDVKVFQHRGFGSTRQR
ncbi:hypothetical protein Hdeb2414_s0025g00662141 [Helianthus debilis subsp. tardiflorus]